MLRLPIELLEKIIKKVPLENVLELRGTSKTLRNAVDMVFSSRDYLHRS